MLKFLSQLLASILGGLIILFIIVPLIVIGIIAANVKPLAPSVVLTLDLRSGLPERDGVSFDSNQQGIDGDSLLGVVRTLEIAEQDPRVKSLYLRVGGIGLPVAQAQELREAIDRFRATGKKVVAHVQSSFTAGLGPVYVASAADEVVMQESGQLFSSGMVTSSLFMRELLDEIGVEAQFGRYKDYKNAANTFLNDDYTDEQREARTALITSIHGGVLEDIAAARSAAGKSVTVQSLQRVFNDVPILARNALDAGLVDRFDYHQNVRAALLAEAGAGAAMLSVDTYAEEPRRPKKSGTMVALVHAVGPINEGRSSNSSPFGGSDVIGGDSLAKAITDAAANAEVKAILLRVDSPGGSAVASEQVRYAVAQAREAGKPVVVSMSSVAASGGYWISMSSDHIAAHPATITGSIGVITGKFITAGLFDKIGANLGEIPTNDGALFFSSQRGFSEDEWQRLDRSLNAIYTEFVDKAAAGRSAATGETVDPDALEAFAQGRIWSGADALERGLIDSTGGYRHAMDVVREKLGLEEGADLRVKLYPAPPSFFELFDAMMSSSGASIRAGQKIEALLDHPDVSRILHKLDAPVDQGPAAYEETQPVR